MAALLSDQIDRLTHRTRSIKAIAQHTAHSDAPSRISRPFTHAVLNAEVGHLIRDVDSTELGLFSLKRSSNDPPTHEGHLKRVEFVGATPLRKTAARRDDRVPEIAPEVHAQSALKLLHRYHKIRPMPRAGQQLSGIIDRLDGARQRIARLETTLREQEKDQPQARLTLLLFHPDTLVVSKSSLKAEEETIRQLHSRLEELNERKKALLARKSSKLKLPASKPAAKPARRVSSPLEDKLRSPPGEASRTLKFTSNLLLDEEVDFNGLGDASFTMPTPRKGGATTDSGVLNFTTSDPTPDAEEALLAPSPPEKENDRPRSPPVSLPGEHRQPELQPDTPQKAAPPELAEPARQTPRVGGVKLGAEVERISSKIASVYSDMLSHTPDGRRPSSTKDIVAALRAVSEQTPSLDSPSHSSVSTATSQGPSGQEILTAYLLVQLLTAPDRAVPLNKLKDSLSTKAKSSGLTVGTLGQNSTRILYGCIGKRLIKIDRSGGEQLVKFDC